MKDMLEGMFDWHRRVNRINAIVTPISSLFLFLLQYFHLIPENDLIKFLIIVVYSFLYFALFLSIVLYQLKQSHEKNLKKLNDDIREMKS